MMTRQDDTLTVRLASRIAFLPVAVRCIETAAGVFGLGRDEALKLSLATEEIFACLCHEVCRGEPLEIECQNKLYYARVQFRFSVSALNLGGLNITSTMADDPETAQEHMGLMIAARSVDRLNIIVGKNNQICLTIEKEKAYPLAPQIALPAPDPVGNMAPTSPDMEGLKQFAIRVAQTRPVPLRPPFFNYPGKVADMAAGGDHQAIVVETPKGDIAGGILMTFRTDRIVQIYGPYVFTPSAEAEMAKMLLDACISSIARTRAIGLVSLNGVPVSLTPQFEPLGTLSYSPENGEMLRQSCFYRLLHEDPGSVIWTHSDLKGYLEQEYRRLVLARDIKVVQDLGETRSGVSIFSAEVNGEMSTVTLRPLWPGADFAANVERHARFLREERVRNIFFELDLGIPWHAALVPGLLTSRFRPEIILPFAGQADLVVFQYYAPRS
jgi:hypothetical protein